MERTSEKSATTLLKKAQSAHAQLADLKEEIKNKSDEVFILAMEELDGKKDNQKNFTWYNFDRSIKIERSTSEPIKFDELTIKACKDKVESFLASNVESKDDYVKEMLVEAFETTGGNLDTKKVLGMLRWRSKIKAPLFRRL